MESPEFDSAVKRCTLWVIACRGVTVFNSSVNKFPHKVKLFHQQRATFLLPQLKNVKEEAPVSPETGNHILYRGRHERSLLTMLGVTFFNFMYWSYQLTISYAYKGVVMNGIEMGGDIKWPIIGMCGTAIMVVSTRLYSRNCVRQAYLTPDGRRLGFQVHTIFAVAGPKFEALLSNTSLVEKEQQKMLMRSIIPVKLEGMDKNLLLDADGIFYDNGKLIQMLESNLEKEENPLKYAESLKAERRKHIEESRKSK